MSVSLSSQLAERLASIESWFYEFDLGPYGRTRSILPPDVLPIHQTRLDLVSRAVKDHFGDRLSDIRCLDVGCHEGFYSVSMSNLGVRQVRGIDVREESIEKARLISDILDLSNVSFGVENCELMDAEAERYELTLLLGVLYHLENPMLVLKKLCALTSELCLIETQVADEVEGFAEW